MKDCSILSNLHKAESGRFALGRPFLSIYSSEKQHLLQCYWFVYYVSHTQLFPANRLSGWLLEPSVARGLSKLRLTLNIWVVVSSLPRLWATPALSHPLLHPWIRTAAVHEVACIVPSIIYFLFELILSFLQWFPVDRHGFPPCYFIHRVTLWGRL